MCYITLSYLSATAWSTLPNREYIPLEGSALIVLIVSPFIKFIFSWFISIICLRKNEEVNAEHHTKPGEDSSAQSGLLGNQVKETIRKEKSLVSNTSKKLLRKGITMQKKILIAYAIAILTIFVLYVPWIEKGSSRGLDEFIGYNPLWSPEDKFGYGNFNEEAVLDWQRILAEFLAVTGVAGVAFYLAKE